MKRESMKRNDLKFDSQWFIAALKSLAAEGAESAETSAKFDGISALLAISAAQHAGQLPMMRQTLRQVARQESGMVSGFRFRVSGWGRGGDAIAEKRSVRRNATARRCKCNRLVKNSMRNVARTRFVDRKRRHAKRRKERGISLKNAKSGEFSGQGST